MKRYWLLYTGLILALLGGFVPDARRALRPRALQPSWCEGQILDASTPYWKNGNLPASKDDWNAWF